MRHVLRALARSLVRGDADADDLIQDVAIATIEHPPAVDRPVLPWLVLLMRNLRMDRWFEARLREYAIGGVPESAR